MAYFMEEYVGRVGPAPIEATSSQSKAEAPWVGAIKNSHMVRPIEMSLR